MNVLFAIKSFPASPLRVTNDSKALEMCVTKLMWSAALRNFTVIAFLMNLNGSVEKCVCTVVIFMVFVFNTPN